MTVLSQNLILNCNVFRVIPQKETCIFLIGMIDFNQITCFGKTFLTEGEVAKFVLSYRK